VITSVFCYFLLDHVWWLSRLETGRLNVEYIEGKTDFEDRK